MHFSFPSLPLQKQNNKAKKVSRKIFHFHSLNIWWLCDSKKDIFWTWTKHESWLIMFSFLKYTSDNSQKTQFFRKKKKVPSLYKETCTSELTLLIYDWNKTKLKTNNPLKTMIELEKALGKNLNKPNPQILSVLLWSVIRCL